MYKKIENNILKYLPDLKLEKWKYDSCGYRESAHSLYLDGYRFESSNYSNRDLSTIKEFRFKGIDYDSKDLYIKDTFDLDMIFLFIIEIIKKDRLVKKIEEDIILINHNKYSEVYKDKIRDRKISDILTNN